MIKYPNRKYKLLIHDANNKSLQQNANPIKGTVLDLGCGVKPFKQEIERLSDTHFGVDWPSSLHDTTASGL